MDATASFAANFPPGRVRPYSSLIRATRCHNLTKPNINIDRDILDHSVSGRRAASYQQVGVGQASRAIDALAGCET